MVFVDALALFPVVQAAHAWEEWPQFPNWVRRFASSRYTDREYVITHVLAIASAVAVALVVRAFPNRPVIFAMFAFAFGPGIACNALFHVGATVLSRHYCPGALTSIVLYVPLALWLMVLVVREGLLSPTAVAVALLVAATVHVLEVGHNVFKRW